MVFQGKVWCRSGVHVWMEQGKEKETKEQHLGFQRGPPP